MRSNGVRNESMYYYCKKEDDVEMKEIKLMDKMQVLGKDLDFYGTIEEPLFLAKDIAEWIDYAFKDSRKTARDVTKMLKTVDGDEKLVGRLFLSGQIREVNFLTEDGLYEVLMQSRKPIAKPLKKDIKSILKEIRLKGMHVADNATLEQKAYNYDMLDITFGKTGAEYFNEEYKNCIKFHEENKTRLKYERSSKDRRSDKKRKVAESKIKIMEKVLKIAEEREQQYRMNFQWELKSLISEVVKEIQLDIKTVKHNQTRGKLAQVNKIG